MKMLLTIFALLMATVILAQVSYTDVVYLKNGTVIHGIIVEQIPNQSIKIETKDKNIFVFKMDEIEKIAKEKTETSDYDSKKKSMRSPDYTGYSLIVESHIGTGISTETGSAMTLSGQAVNGIEIQGMYFLGAGAGFDLDDENKNGKYFFLGKFFIDMRLFPVKKELSPLIILSSGFAGDMGDGSYGGFLFNGGGGIKYKLEGKLALNVTLNYKYQDLHFRSAGDYNYPSYNNSHNLQYIVLNFGVSF